MTVRDVAEYFGVTTRSVRNWVAAGRLRAYRVGGDLPRSAIRFRRCELDAALTPLNGSP